jgi:cupin 2 domain-containing protein
MIRYNIFDLKGFVSDPDMELFETIFTGNDCKVERIVSKGHSTPTGEWYDQEQDEWVILLKGKAIIEFESGEILNLEAGDYIFIPAKLRHRVALTSTEPPCVWLAIHGNLKQHNTDI